ncbi:MAG: MFS transporter [Pseudomonadota bacterium]
MSLNDQKRISVGTISGYGIGSIGVGIVTTVPSLLLLYYLTNTLSVEPAIAGIALFLPRFLDVLIDPVIGGLSDRTRSAWGPRKPWMLVGAVGAGIGMSFLFWTPSYAAPMLSLIHVTGVYALMVFASAAFVIPYIAVPADVSDRAADRDRMIAVRLGFSVLGILLSGALATPIVEAAGGGREGYRLFSLCLGVLTTAVMLVSFVTIPVRSDVHQIDTDGGILGPIKRAFGYRPFVELALAYFLQVLAVGIALGAWPYFAAFVLGDEGVLSVLFLLALGSMIASMPIWTLILKRRSKVVAYGSAAFLYALGSSLLILSYAKDGSRWPSYVGFILTGLGSGGLQLVAFGMLATLSNRFAGEGSTTSGAFAGLWFAAEKAGYAFAPLILGSLFSVGGVATASAVSKGAAFTVAVTLAVLPATLNILSTLMIMRRPAIRLVLGE